MSVYGTESASCTVTSAVVFRTADFKTPLDRRPSPSFARSGAHEPPVLKWRPITPHSGSRAVHGSRKPQVGRTRAAGSRHRAGWRNAKHAGQWEATLATYAYPHVGSLSVQAVDTALGMKVLEQSVQKDSTLWTARPETASRLRGRLESILDWAKVRGYRDGENPARWRGHLDKLAPAVVS